MALAQAGIPFDVVPGLTSAVAAPAAAGVPVTHRGVSIGFTVVTGHRERGGSTSIDWEALARVGTTIVILMGVAERREIALRLMNGGMSGTTPVVAIRNGTRVDQEIVRTSLEALGDVDLSAPATIVIGDVAAFDLTATLTRTSVGER